MKQERAINSIPYILAFFALLYLAVPHIVECYESYARPWNTEEHMTNADIAKKHDFHAGGPTVWEMFTETEVKSDKELATILPGETVKPTSSKTILPGVPTPKNETPEAPSGPVGPSNKKELEPAIDKSEYNKPEVPKEEKANARTMDKEIQSPAKKLDSPPKVPRKVSKVSSMPPPPSQTHSKYSKTSGQQIWGPQAPEIDPNQPSPTDSGNGKHGSGIYPSIYGPESLKTPGGNGGDSSDPPPFDFIPAAEFPAGPLHPSPYLNDFSKILKT